MNGQTDGKRMTILMIPPTIKHSQKDVHSMHFPVTNGGVCISYSLWERTRDQEGNEHSTFVNSHSTVEIM